jgi:hypothetical protein
MPAITVANRDWDVVDAVADALRQATIAGAAVFAGVAVTTAEPQARDVHLTGEGPRAVVRYVTTTEDYALEDARASAVLLEVLLAARVAPSADESDRLEEVLRLKNAAVNAVEASPPGDATGWAEGGRYRHPLRWGRPEIDARESPPWAIVRLPLEVALVVDDPAYH